MKKVGIIGAGFSGLAAASYLGAKGIEVHVFEKNATVGGRARQLTESGFVFDMGPSWYWMPDVFEKFFNEFGYKASDFYELKKLDPPYSIIFSDAEVMNVPDDFNQVCEMFERIEPGSSNQLKLFIAEAGKKYHVAMSGLIEKPGDSIREYLNLKTIVDGFSVSIFSSFSKLIKKHFKHPHLIALLEFPVLFLGALPEKIPAMYSLMNYAAFKLGTWYPMGGFGNVIDAMVEIAKKQNVIFHLNEPVEKLSVYHNSITQIETEKGEYKVDAVVGSADYNHIEQQLLSSEYRQYSTDYWDSRTLSPSSLIFYLGVNKKIERLNHHNLFFDEDYSKHAKEIYQTKEWPENPLFYVCCPSVTDPGVAPAGMENLFILMPLAPGIHDDEEIREKYFEKLINRIEKFSGVTFKNNIVYKKSYCISDFKNDYNAYKGNAYGLANTLAQTAIFKPKMKSKKVSNLFFAGQLTVPGPGVPPSLISGRIVSNMLIQSFNKNHEATIR